MGEHMSPEVAEKQSQDARHSDGEKNVTDKETRPVDEIYSSNSDIEHTAGLPVARAERPDAHGEDSDDVDDDGAPSVLDRVVSRVTSRSSIDPGPPPDGGWLAWSQCKLSL